MHDGDTYSCLLDIRYIILERYNGKKSLGNADSIAESDFTRIFIHSFVITFLKELAIRVRLFLAMHKKFKSKI